MEKNVGEKRNGRGALGRVLGVAKSLRLVLVAGRVAVGLGAASARSVFGRSWSVLDAAAVGQGVAAKNGSTQRGLQRNGWNWEMKKHLTCGALAS